METSKKKKSVKNVMNENNMEHKLRIIGFWEAEKMEI